MERSEDRRCKGRPGGEAEPARWHHTRSAGGKQRLLTVKKNAPEEYLIHQRSLDV